MHFLVVELETLLSCEGGIATGLDAPVESKRLVVIIYNA